MRLNNLNIKSFLYLLVASFVLCAACEPTSKPADEPVEQSPVLTLSTQEISVSPEGEELSISYTLENAKEGVELSAECQAAWISNIAIDTEKITLQVAENEDAEREAVIVISYDTIVEEVLGKEWLTTDLFRIGASSAANNLISAIEDKDIKYF